MNLSLFIFFTIYYYHQTGLYIVLYINNFQIILYMRLGAAFPGQTKQENEKRRHTIVPVQETTSAGESTPPDHVTSRAFQKLVNLRQGRQTPPMQVYKS